jgi:DNA-binding transcriptional MocR family regulator
MDDLGSSVTEQAALASFIRNGQYENHLRKSVKEIADRRRVIVEAFQSAWAAYRVCQPIG